MSSRPLLALVTLGTATVLVAGAASAAATETLTLDRGGSTPSTGYVSGRLLVHYRSGIDRVAQQALEHAAGASRVSEIAALGVHVLGVPAGTEQTALNALTNSGKVEYAERDAVVHATATPDDPYWSQQWGPTKIRMPLAWDTTTGSASTTIAVLDSGVDFSHPDLQGRFVAGYDFVNNDTTATDDYGHGTKSAGVAGAASNNNTGVASMCWSCSLMPVKILDSTGAGSYGGLINGITWATDHGADVISMSIVGNTPSSSLQSAVQYAHDRGVVLVGGAGNAGNSTATYPASYPEVVSVAGSTSSDTLYSWSSYGSWVDVAAPGCTTSTVMGGSYGSFCGTSSATPVVSGLVGILRSAKPSATVGEIEQALEATAVPIGSQVAYGRVDGAAALTTLLNGGPPPAPSPSPTPTSSPSPAPSPSATPTPSASPTSATTTFSGSVSGKSGKSYVVNAGQGPLAARLTFSKASSLTLQLVDASGSVLAVSSSGSPVQLSTSVPAGTYSLVVSGGRTSFTLAVTTQP
jgi:subtilisin family serine protease